MGWRGGGSIAWDLGALSRAVSTGVEPLGAGQAGSHPGSDSRVIEGAGDAVAQTGGAWKGQGREIMGGAFILRVNKRFILIS